MTQANPSNTALSLSHYLTAVKVAVDEIFYEDVWVVAEIRSVSSKGGHYYFELAEKDSAGGVVASCRATLWKSRAKGVLSKFTAATDAPPQAGQNILIKGAARFHPQYGFSIQINEIDPSYTLGALAQAYQAMQQKLHEMGLINLNKQLPTPFDIQQVIVIAPERAAGLGDFRADADRLQATGACHFHYHHATFQGNHAPAEIRAAMVAAFAQFAVDVGGLPDLLVIIRGGGAVGDLAYLNDYELAAMVAESPVPVWVGVGHERDRVILDDVAHTRFDTPSKVIAAITAHLLSLWQGAKQHQLSILRHAQHLNDLHRQSTLHQYQQVNLHCQSILTQAKQNSSHAIDQIAQQSSRLITHTRQDTQQLWMRHQVIYQHLERWRMDIRHLQSMTLNQHPRNILNKGYALVRHADSGAIISHKKDAPVGTRLMIEFKDGQVSALAE